eukprot:CAMPEP_0174825088 /NCGR_PEP_ID=MMETSP1107-20130205/42015_1 /TAXON_ID=36770 /ORGANISM="Paraphysomonas vestita, Strain GFlagA" /LENGTH=141 /DNA_ID=CAMNT_0016056227 /DNA_START=23 /DNA_END=444 /DNA_ORIENTATION=-
MNALLVVTQESVHGLATNGFAKTTVSEHIPLVPWPLKPGIELHTSRWIDITPPSTSSGSSGSYSSFFMSQSQSKSQSLTPITRSTLISSTNSNLDDIENNGVNKNREKYHPGASTYLVSLSNGLIMMFRLEAVGGETVCGG